MRKRTAILITLLALNLVQYNVWPYAEKYCTYFFYKMETLQYMLTFYLMKYPPMKPTKTYNFLLRAWLIFAINDAVDLLFFNPHEIGWNEIIFCIIAIIYPLIAQKWIAARKHRASL